MPSTCEFRDLLGADPRVHLEQIESLPWVQQSLHDGKEVAANLDQDPLVMEHVDTMLPVILASTSTMWAVREQRPFTPNELLCGQCVSVSERDWKLCGFDQHPLSFAGFHVTDAAKKRMAGNTFNQAVFSSLILWTMAKLKPNPVGRATQIGSGSDVD